MLNLCVDVDIENIVITLTALVASDLLSIRWIVLGQDLEVTGYFVTHGFLSSGSARSTR